MGTIFVGGVHGVGKTEACKSLADNFSLSHFTASNLIKSLDSSAVKAHTKSVDSVPKNQSLLVQAVNKFFLGGKTRLVLDGHFAVPNAESQFELVSVCTFAQLSLEAIVVLFDDPNQIHFRRLSRDQSSLGAHEIDRVQLQELEHAKFVSRSLNLPFFSIKSFDTKTFLRAIQGIWPDL